MKITLKLYASLSEHLPSGADRNTVDIEIPDSASPWWVIDRYQVPREQAHLILVNGFYMDGNARENRTFQSGDTMAVWPPVAGG